MKKRNLFLAVALIALMTGVLSAQTYDSESDFQVTKNGNAITITKYVGTKTAVNIPPNIQNTPVTTIGNNAFADNARIANIIIPASVTNISQFAFSGCRGLASITIGSGVTGIEMYAFTNCINLANVTFQGTIRSGVFNSNAFPNLGDLRAKFYATDSANGTPGTYTRSGTIWTIAAAAVGTAQYDAESDFGVKKEDNVITITEYRASKTVINIPPRIQNLPVTIIGNSAFSGWDITSITIPNSVTSIEGGAFSLCGSLTSITIPNSITSIGSRSFQSCTSLTSVTFQGTIPSSGFSTVANTFPGDLRDKFYATDKAKGTAGTYTRPNGTSTTWTKK